MVSWPTVHFLHQPPNPASPRYTLWFRAIRIYPGGMESVLLANHSTTSLKRISEGAAKMGHRRATAPQRHLFQGNTPSRAEGEQADVFGAFLMVSEFKHELLHSLQHQLTIPNQLFLQPSPPGLLWHLNCPRAKSLSHSLETAQRDLTQGPQFCTGKEMSEHPHCTPEQQLSCPHVISICSHSNTANHPHHPG